MPELPEVETTLRGLQPLLQGQVIRDLIVRRSDLRWPVPGDLADHLRGHTILSLQRRAKYLLLRLESGTLIVHLGMSGSLVLIDGRRPAHKHDHIDLLLRRGPRLRYRDPRRFGAWLWTEHAIDKHPLLRNLGPEPLGPHFDGIYLHQVLRHRKTPIKTAIMNAHIVVGVGNIYACEALNLARLLPTSEARCLSRARCDRLVYAIKDVLSQAIEAGGTTLRDFVGGDGQPGYFARQLRVYGREGLPCPACNQPVQRQVMSARSTFFCRGCQK